MKRIKSEGDYTVLSTNSASSHDSLFKSWSQSLSLISLSSEWFLNFITLFYIPLMIFFSILIGVLFYHYFNSWPLSTSIFYAVNTLLGELFMVPGNKTPIADVFTVLYYIYGAFFLAGIIGQYVGVLVSKAPELAAIERKKLYECPESPIDSDQDGYVGIRDYCEFLLIRVRHRMGWEDHKWKYITFFFVLLWLGVGVLYGLVMESKSFGSALFFALSTIAGACYVGPGCDGNDDTDCEIGMTKEILLTIYVLIGYPLFTILLGQFGSVFIEKTVREHEKKILRSPLTEEEFRYAANLYGDDELISLGEFTILELLRLQRVSLEDLERIREVFTQIDISSTGNLTKPMLVKSNLYRGYGSFDDVELLKKEPEPAAAEGVELFHYLTENDRANSLPPEITSEMYAAVIRPSLLLNPLETSLTGADRSDPEESSFPFPPTPPPLSISPKKRVSSLRLMRSQSRCDIPEEREKELELERGESEGEAGKIGGIERSNMTISKYNEVVIPLAVSAVLEGIDFCDPEQVSNLYEHGDY